MSVWPTGNDIPELKNAELGFNNIINCTFLNKILEMRVWPSHMAIPVQKGLPLSLRLFGFPVIRASGTSDRLYNAPDPNLRHVQNHFKNSVNLPVMHAYQF